MATIVYNGAKYRFMRGELALHTHDIRCMLLESVTTTPDNPDHEFVADIVADEHSDGSYARVACTGETVSQNDSADRAEFDIDNPVFSALSGNTVTAAVLYRHVTNDADSPLISYHDFGDTTPDGTDFTLVVGASGAVHLT